MKQISQINKTNQFEHPARPPILPANRSYVDAVIILLNIERENRRIPCQDTDFVDFMRVIR
jgi:hypothetical protein